MALAAEGKEDYRIPSVCPDIRTLLLDSHVFLSLPVKKYPTWEPKAEGNQSCTRLYDPNVEKGFHSLCA